MVYNSVKFSKDGQYIEGWSLSLTNHPCTKGIMFKWRKIQGHNEFLCYDLYDPITPLSSETSEEHKKKLHPTLLAFLKEHNPAEPGSALTFLYYLKANRTSSELKTENQSTFRDISLNQVGGIRRGIFVYGETHPVTVDGMIDFIRKKNKTFLNVAEMETAINKIDKSHKTVLLQSFLDYYRSNQNSFVPRGELVENWVTFYQSVHRYNPFDQLTQHRERGCLKMFNPSKTDSIDFFEKFLKGESISSNLRSMLDMDPYLEVAISKQPGQ